MLRELQKSVFELIRKQARKLGCDIHRAVPAHVWEIRIPRLLNQSGVRTVIDVGANQGQYAKTLLENGLRASILSFEPLPEAWNRLKRTAASNRQWTVAERIALSDSNREAVLHEAGNSVSSSMLRMTPAHLDAAPESATVNVVQVKTMRLDDYLANHPVQAPAFLKIDVQGAEMSVLAGAKNVLRDLAIGVQLEMSLKTLYTGQNLYWETDRFLRQEGFECCDIIPEFRDPTSSKLLQYDAIYFKEGIKSI